MIMVNKVCGLLPLGIVKEVRFIPKVKQEVTQFLVDLGHMVNNVWTATPLNDLHNLENPAKVQHLQKEHPHKDDLIGFGQTKGQLRVT